MMLRPRGGVGAMIPAALAVLAVAGCAVRTERRDPLTSGMAKEKLVSGVTTQGEVLETFGAPNIITRDREGRESWAYERSRFTSSSQGGALTIVTAALRREGDGRVRHVEDRRHRPQLPLRRRRRGPVARGGARRRGQRQ